MSHNSLHFTLFLRGRHLPPNDPFLLGYRKLFPLYCKYKPHFDNMASEYRGSRSAEVRNARMEMTKARANFAMYGSATGGVGGGVGGGATLVGGVIVGGDEEKPGEIPMSCSSSTYNIHEMLANNIHESSYYKSLSTITDFNQLVDEIYNRCDHAGMYISTPQGGGGFYALPPY